MAAAPCLASHLRSVEIQVKRQNCSAFKVEIVITAYLNSQSAVNFGGQNDYLRFGDGFSHLIPETAAEIIDASLHISRVIYKTVHEYAGPGTYTISYSESNRNFGILNFDDSGNTTFYTETSISLQGDKCNNSPILLVPPIDRACSGTRFFHNPGAFDADGDSLSYELVTPLKGPGSPVMNYRFPDDPAFYSGAGLSYAQGNEEKTGPPAFAINAIDGTITWDAPGMTGEYSVAVKVNEWQFNASDSTWHKTGYVIRDMQIIVEAC
ncbi:MAG TPA: hypothetical protein VF490_06105, partial [Chryseosolibacter sp.]